MFGIDDSMLFAWPKRTQPVMPSPMPGPVGVGDPTQMQPQATVASSPQLTMPSPSPTSMPTSLPTKKIGPQVPGATQGLF